MADLFTTWPRVRVSHVSAGDGKTLCGKATDPSTWDEGGFVSAEDDDACSCAKCQSAMRKIAVQEARNVR